MAQPGYDAVVVGGGLVGTSLAYHLVARGAHTALVDRHDSGRATDAGAGILSPETTKSDDDRWTAFALASGAYYPELVEQLETDGAGDTGYGRCGLLSVAVNDSDVESFVWASRLARARLDTIREVTPAETAERFPPLVPVQRALLNPNAARVDGRLMSAALLRAAQRLGLVVVPQSAGALSFEGRRVTAVQAGPEELRTGALAIAGGAWSPAFAEQLELRLPVIPVRGQIVHLELPGAATGGWPIVQQVLGLYVVPWPDGRVAVGATAEPDAGFDARATARGVRDMLRAALWLAPGLADATLAEVRVGLRPVCTDGSPVVGPVPGFANVHVATGHAADGLLLGPFSGKLVAGAILGDAPPALDLRTFSPARFA